MSLAYSNIGITNQNKQVFIRLIRTQKKDLWVTVQPKASELII